MLNMSVKEAIEIIQSATNFNEVVHEGNFRRTMNKKSLSDIVKERDCLLKELIKPLNEYFFKLQSLVTEYDELIVPLKGILESDIIDLRLLINLNQEKYGKNTLLRSSSGGKYTYYFLTPPYIEFDMEGRYKVADVRIIKFIYNHFNEIDKLIKEEFENYMKSKFQLSQEKIDVVKKELKTLEQIKSKFCKHE